MKLCANAVTHKITNNAVTALLAIGLHSVAYIADFVAGYSLFDAFIETLAGCIDQPLCLGRASPCNKCGSIIAVIAILRGSEINAYDITLPDDTMLARNAVNNFIVYRYTCSGGKSVKA